MDVRNLFVVAIVAVLMLGFRANPKAPMFLICRPILNWCLFSKNCMPSTPIAWSKHCPGLKAKYGNFLEGYSTRVINIGRTDQCQLCIDYLRSFLEYDANKDVYEECKKSYTDLAPLRQSIESAFKHYLHYYPDAALPDVYLLISGFNQSMVVDSGLVGVSVEKYLGADCQFYEWLAIPNYLRRKMVPEKIVPDIMKAIAYTEFTYNDSIDNVLNNMVYQGKVLYFVKKMMPALHDSLLFDYSKAELAWCNKHESTMWKVMVEKRYLFGNNRMDIQKFIGDAPFTSFFGQESPGRAANWIGYQIVDAYMVGNPTVTLPQLMSIDDGQVILAGSAYRP
jgi:hypothetical protein